MKISNTIYYRILSFTLIALLLTSCGKTSTTTLDGPTAEKKKTPVKTTGVKAIYRSDANMYGTITMVHGMISPLGDLADMETKQKIAELEAATGLTEQDILSFTLCGTINDISMADVTAITDDKELPVNVAVSLGKAITFDQMIAAMKILNQDSDPEAVYEKADVAGQAVLKLISSDNPDRPQYAALGNDGKTLYIGMSQSEISRTVESEINDQPEALPAPLEQVYTSTSNEIPFRVAMLVPEAVRANINDKHQEILAEGGIAAAVTGGLYAPFVNLQTLALTGDPDIEGNFNLTIIGDLASETAAAKGEATMSMITGLIGGLVPPSEEGESSFNFAQALKTRIDGKHLILEMKIPQDELNQ